MKEVKPIPVLDIDADKVSPERARAMLDNFGAATIENILVNGEPIRPAVHFIDDNVGPIDCEFEYTYVVPETEDNGDGTFTHTVDLRAEHRKATKKFIKALDAITEAISSLIVSGIEAEEIMAALATLQPKKQTKPRRRKEKRPTYNQRMMNRKPIRREQHR